MATYMILLRGGDIFDPAEMEVYQRVNRENSGELKLKSVLVYGYMSALEGDAPDGILVLEFSTAEEVQAWYYSPQYQAAAEHRRKAANYRVIIVEGL